MCKESKIPTFKIVLDKLTNLEKENLINSENKLKNKQILIGELSTQSPNMVPINTWKRNKEPIKINISNKPKIPENANKVLDGLSSLRKQGKF